MATAQHNFALLRKTQKKFDEAKELFLKALEYRRQHYGRSSLLAPPLPALLTYYVVSGLTHPLFEQSVNSILSLYTQLGDTEAIESLKSSLPDKWKPLN